MAEPFGRPYPRKTFTHSWKKPFACLNDDATCSASLRTIGIIQRIRFDLVFAVPRTKRFRCRICQHLFVRAVFLRNFVICDGFTRHMVSKINVLRGFPTYFCPLWASWLSSYTTAYSVSTPCLLMTFLRNRNSDIHSDSALYSASVEVRAVHFCLYGF